MHHKYLKDQIAVELNEAANYLRKAIDLFSEYPNWAKMFKAISDERQRTSGELYKMFIQLCSDIKGQDAYISSIRDAAMNNFSDMMRKIEDYEMTYNIILSQERDKGMSTDERDTAEPGDNQVVRV